MTRERAGCTVRSMIFAATIAAIAALAVPNATIIPEACPNGSGMPCAERATATIYVPDGTSRFGREHELGHLFDAQFLDDGERNALKRAMGLPVSRPWSTGTGLTAGGLASPSEKFADLYAACRLRMDPDRRWETGYDYQPSRRALRLACGVLARAGADHAGSGTAK